MSQNQSTNPESHSSIERDYTKNKNLNKIIAGIVLALVIVSGGVMLKNKQSPNNDPSNTPAEEVDSNVPREARDFVKNYGDRYADPVSTYYAEKALEAQNNGKSFILSDKEIKEYQPPEVTGKSTGAISPLGFERSEIKMDKNMGPAEFQTVFNQYMSKQVSIYMNLLAKNPESAWPEIDYEFIRSCSDADGQFMNGSHGSNVLTSDDKPISNLMDWAKEIVRTGGSNTNYNIKSLSIDTKDYENNNVSYMLVVESPQHTTSKFNNQNVEFWSAIADRIVVEKDTYTGSNSTADNYVSHNFQIGITLVPDGDLKYISIGKE